MLLSLMIHLGDHIIVFQFVQKSLTLNEQSKCICNHRYPQIMRHIGAEFLVHVIPTGLLVFQRNIEFCAV